jgi:hypothetical protein
MSLQADFLSKLNNLSTLTTTENGALAYNTTDSKVLDLFASIGAIKNDAKRVDSLFTRASIEDIGLTLKTLFYLRDIRGGIGNQENFLVGLKTLAILYPEQIEANIHLIPFYGRWDDLYTLVETPVERAMWDFITYSFYADIELAEEGKQISLCAKWLKRPDASNQRNAMLGKLTAAALGLTEKQYRKMLTFLRSKLNLVETNLTNKTYSNIKFSQVPSRAMKRYKTVFYKKMEEDFKQFISNVKEGKETIKATTLIPSDLIKEYPFFGERIGKNSEDPVVEAQWKALPNYVTGERDIVIMADTSGSMCGDPIAASVGLGIYFAERNKGAFKNVFMTFASKPSFIRLPENASLYQKLKLIPEIIDNTNLEAAFELILDVCIETEKEAPVSLVVISDMEFDSCESNYRTNSQKLTWYEIMKQRFKDAGFTIPNIVYWNVDSRHENFQVKHNEPYVQLCSGSNQSGFKDLINNVGKNPYEAMLGTLNKERYSFVKVV